MARSQISNLSPKVLGASGVFTFQPTDLPFPTPGRGISEFLLTLTDSSKNVSIAAALLGGANILSRIRVRAGGQTIIDCTPYELAEFITQLSDGHPGIGAGVGSSFIGGAFGLKNAISFRIPFTMLDSLSEDEQDLCQFPLNQNPSIEITTGSSATSSMYATVASTVTDIMPKLKPKLLAQAMNVPASASSFRVPISESGLIRAVGLCAQSQDIASTVWTVTKGFQRYKLVLANVEKFNMTPLLLWESQHSRSGYTGDVGAAVTTIPSLVYYKNVGMLPGPAGFSYIEVDSGDYSGTYTNANMGTPAATTDYVLWALENQ